MGKIIDLGAERAWREAICQTAGDLQDIVQRLIAAPDRAEAREALSDMEATIRAAAALTG